MAGYSATPLAKKLGIKENFRVKTRNAPANYLALLEPIPGGVKISSRLTSSVNIWHLFVDSRRDLAHQLQMTMKEMPDDGIIWVSWPKKASGIKTDVSEDDIRSASLPLGLVDIKVCAVDEIWSGLKLVVRKSNRK